MNRSASASQAPCAGCAARRAAARDEGAVGRRAFLSAAMLAAAAVVLEACGGSGNVDFFTGPSGGPLVVKVSDFSALANVGGVARVDNGAGAPTALARTGVATFVGVTMVCTHQGATIDVVGGTSFRCPNHGALFSATGSWQGGQATASLATYAATFDGVNTVTIARP